MDWFRSSFGSDYPKIYQHRNESEAKNFIRSLKKVITITPQSKILDLCCGCGRYSIALAEQGYSVVGFDLSWDLLQCAVNEVKNRGFRIPFIRGDMRYLTFHEEFDVVLNMFTSFGYFSSDNDNLKTLNDIHRILKTKGWLVIDYINSNNVKNNFRPYDEIHNNGYRIIQERRIDHNLNLIIKKIVIKENGDERTYCEKVKLYTKQDFMSMMKHTGFSVVQYAGNYDLKEYKPDSPRLIVIGKK